MLAIRMIVAVLKETRKRKKKKRKRGQWKEKWNKNPAKKEKRGKIDTRVYMNLRVLYTHLAATYFGSEISCFQGLLLRRLELLSVLDRGHPETYLVHVIMTLSFITIALDERRCTEVFQTGSGTGQGLPSALGTSTRVLQKIVQSFFFSMLASLSPPGRWKFLRWKIIFVPWENYIRSKVQSILVDNLEYSTIDCVRPTHLPEPRTPRIYIRKRKFNRSWNWLLFSQYLSNLYNLYLYL